ncbi:MAG: ACT domain-containing protein [Tissierellia bacterium]|nr:ACT domain-containing protein [Tissierellia bacterium]
MKQISVYVENKVGSLEEATQILAKNKVNIRAFSVFDTTDFSILRMVVEPFKKAEEVLEENGFVWNSNEVLGLPLKDTPGSLHEVLALLKEGGFNVNYMYSIVMQEEGTPLIILHTDQMDKAAKFLKEKDYVIQ